MCIAVVGLKAQDFGKMSDSLIEASFAEQCKSEIVMRGKIVRLHPHRLVQLSNRFVDSPLNSQSRGKIEARFRIVRRKAYRLGIDEDCLGSLLLGRQRHAEIVTRDNVAGF